MAEAPAKEEGLTDIESKVSSGNLESGAVDLSHVMMENQKRDKKHVGEEPKKSIGGAR